MTSANNALNGWQTSFEEISSFSDKQVTPILSELANNKTLKNILATLFENNADSGLINSWFEQLRDLRTISEFQDWIEQAILPIISNSYDRLVVEGIEKLDPNVPYIFISNHRDIVMDPLLLNQTLKQHSFSTAHCAIGDNLLVSPIANDLARLNNCFKVVRSLKSPKAILKAMKVQSAYIAYRHFETRNNIWIAQKEGRSKDNSDKTNPALIKMLGLARPKDMTINDYYKQLNIVPVCYSYEWDPVDVDKATQLESQMDDTYIKRHEDDLSAVKKGLSGSKGSVYIRFGSPIRDESEDLNHSKIVEAIDQFVQNNYQHFPVNIAAFKKLNPTSNKDSQFDKSSINLAWKELESRIADQSNAIQKRVLEAYAAPLLK